MTANTVQILHADWTLLPDGLAESVAVAVADGAITEIGPVAELRRRFLDSVILRLEGQALLPGFVNAHQHGRGLTSTQLGLTDDLLELWLARGRRRSSVDPYWITALAALDMIANGVTAVIHANTPYLTGDFTGEIRAFARAYQAAGLRALVGIGARDRAEVVYPHTEQPGFLAGLPPDLRAYVGDPSRPMYAGDAVATVAVMEDMQREFAGAAGLAFAYAPAGPQWVSDDMFRDLAADAAARGVAIHTHGLESHAQAQALGELYPEGFLARFEKLGLLSERLSLAHAVWLSRDDIALARAYGVTFVRNPGSNLRLRAGIAPLSAYLAGGVHVALGSDSGTLHEDEDLFKELRLAAGLSRSPMWDSLSPPTTADMLAMTTTAGAHAMGLDEQIGQIAKGRAADLIGVSLERINGTYLDEDVDLLSAIYARATGNDVRMTMIAGRIVFRDGVFPLLDRTAIEAQAVAEARRSRIADPITREQVNRLVEAIAGFYRQRHHRLAGASWQPLAEPSPWL